MARADCPECAGSGQCVFCDGSGIDEGKECAQCDGSGVCAACDDGDSKIINSDDDENEQ